LSSDLTDFDALSNEIETTQPEAVVHLAGISFVDHGSANTIYQVNLMGTRNLLEALVKHAPDIQSVLIASSANVYGNSNESLLTEDTVPVPANDYGVSKLAMEHMARLWSDKLPIFIVRPFNYTGRGQSDKFVIPKIISHFREGKIRVELGNLDVWREFGDVRSVADIYRRLLQKCPAGETINVCTGEVHSLAEVIQLCEEITGRNMEIYINPQFVRANELRVLKGGNGRLIKTIDTWSSYTLESTLTWMLATQWRR
jgi:GDP-6-deoxy-D-talose 4-dehydrogenase